ncbi:MAG: hypothetical protein H6733_17195 [Alphaproteobacteria bacterium]|nr:hypothetical protein [Alphaproteobacteria bacterium]
MRVWVALACGLVAAGCGTPLPADGRWDGAAFADDGTVAGPPVAALRLFVEPVVRGEPTAFRVSGLAGGQRVFVGVSAHGVGTGPCVRGVCLDLDRPVRLGSAVAGPDGVAALDAVVPAGLPYVDATFQAVAWGPDGLSQTVAVDVVDAGQDAIALRAGVGSLALGGALPSELAVWNRRAVPVALDGDGAPFVAAARVNAGKVVVGAHESILLGGVATGTPGGGQLLRNALDWMGGGVVGVQAGHGSLVSWLQGQGYTVVTADATTLAGVDVFVTDLYTDLSPAVDDALRTWIQDGGGLVAGGHAWYWGQTHDDAAELFPGNQVLRDTGILVSEATSQSGTHTVPATAVSPLDDGTRCLDALLAHVQGTTTLSLADQARAVRAAGVVTGVLPPTWRDWYEHAEAVFAAQGDVVPTEADPVDPDTEPLDAFQLQVLAAEAAGLPAADVVASPAAADFPGTPAPGAAHTTVTTTVDATYAGRSSGYLYSGAAADRLASTGWWAPAGEVVRITVPASAVSAGLTVRIGSHTDTLWGADTWTRVPAIGRSFPIRTTTTEVASAYGGLIYVGVPAGTALGTLPVVGGNVVLAPTFRKGTSTNATWVGSERGRPAPWGELVGDRVVLTLPSDVLATIGDAQGLVDYWDAVLDAEADLAAIDRDRVRKERLVVDRQISAGWMHSGYPIMAHLASASDWVDLAALQTSGDWGAFHELGHNHQWRDWLLPGTTEATCNLWSTYVMETLVGLPPRTGHPALAPADRAARIADYLAGGADFWADWSVWTALETHLQLQEAFGWTLFEDLNALYLADAPGAVANTDQARIDTFVRRTSQLAGVDLGPFYTAWGLPVSAAVLTEISALPVWADDPMNP